MKAKAILAIAIMMLIVSIIFSYILVSTSVIPGNGEADITREDLKNMIFQVSELIAGNDQQDQYIDYDMGSFMVNLIVFRSQRVLRTRITLELHHQAQQEIEKRHPQLRDTVITILRQGEVTPQGDLDTTILKTKIKDTINEIIGEEVVNRVFFRELVIN